MAPKYMWDEFSREWMPTDELSLRHLRHVEDRRRAQGEHDRAQFAGAAKRPQEPQVVEFAP